MRDRKYQFEYFDFYDSAGIEEHLADMAARGWLVEKIGAVLWRYRRIPAQTLHFAVTYFPRASDYDPGPSAGQLQMESYCARDGWIPAASRGQMQIYYNEAANPIPIETDAATQVETIRRAIKRGQQPGRLLLLALCVFQLVFQGWRCLSDPLETLSTPAYVFVFPTYLLIAAVVLLEMVSYHRWYRRAKAAAAAGEFVNVKIRRRASWILLTFSILLLALSFSGYAWGGRAVLLWGAAMVVAYIAIRITSGWLKKKGASRRLNQSVSITLALVLSLVSLSVMTAAIIAGGLHRGGNPVGSYEYNGHSFDIYQDDLPLRIEDMLAVRDTAWSRERRRQETALLANTEYRQWPLLTEGSAAALLEYTVSDIKAPFLYEICLSDLLRRYPERAEDGTVLTQNSYIAGDPAPWDAQAVYQLYRRDDAISHYVLCYENRLVEIGFSWEPTAGHMAVVAEKLGGH